MNVTIVTTGTEGDIRPYVALAIELKKEGHRVKFASFGIYAEFVEHFDIEFVLLHFESPQHSSGIFKYFRTMKVIELSAETKESYLSALWNVCKDADSIIYNAAGYPCLYIAEKLGIPSFAATMQPYHQTKAFPHPLITDGNVKGSIYNLISYTWFDFLHWRYVRKYINKWRKETLGLPEMKANEGVLHQLKNRKPVMLYGYSPGYLPAPADWPKDNIYVTGYWFLDTSVNWEPPADLKEFLSNGPPPVYISKIWNGNKLTTEVLEQIMETTSCRFILQAYGDENTLSHYGDRMFCVKGYIPHEWLFPRMAAVVHHGGLGTTMNALRAGTPMVTIPADGMNDHKFWSLITARWGLGTTILTSEKKRSFKKELATAIEKVINDRVMTAKVENVGKAIRAENGVGEALKAFNQYVAQYAERV